MHASTSPYQPGGFPPIQGGDASGGGYAAGGVALVQDGEAEASAPGTLLVLRPGRSPLRLMPGEAGKREGSLVSVGVLASRNRNPKDSWTFLPVRVQWAGATRRAHALVDSGATGNLMDVGLAQGWRFPLLSLSEPVPVMGLDGRPLRSGFITRRTVPVRVRVAGGLWEDIQFFIVDSPECSLVLGHPWLVAHKPRIVWSTGRLILEGGSAPILFRSPPTTHQPKPPSQTTYQSSPLPQVPHSKPPTVLAAVATGRTAAIDSVTGPDLAGIPREHELVKGPKKVEKVDINAELAARWKYCALSTEKLRRPIVACDLGRLYNKDAVIEYLLDKSADRPNSEVVSHLRGIKDVKELNLTDNPAWEGERRNTKGDRYEDMHCAMFICPVVGLEMNGKHRSPLEQ
ncbi:hypothetical protein J4Q44_G00078780 [Coregonus suidteri]|uniref:Uncharacterized protein n=1 Tax=Coregonus suidteri TaxID=861788 RepID=A0AAN8RBJ9_9TELE